MVEKRLGRGLDFLITEETQFEGDEILELDIESIIPNRLQPRKEFGSEELRELAASIETHGVLQPIVVRPFESGYEIIAGERRWRACKSLGKDTIPAVIRDVNDEELLELALIENLHRSDLNPIEKAEACRRLIDDFKLNQESAARKIGKSRSSLANLLRLLELPEVVRRRIASGEVSVGHAKALLALESEEEQLALCEEILAGGVTVRDAERRTSESSGTRKKGKKKRGSAKPNYILDLEDRLRKALGTKVAIVEKKGSRGRIVIDFFSKEDFDRILGLLESGR
jgi:ParB family chromosome partitioning protein